MMLMHFYAMRTRQPLCGRVGGELDYMSLGGELIGLSCKRVDAFTANVCKRTFGALSWILIGFCAIRQKLAKIFRRRFGRRKIGLYG